MTEKWRLEHKNGWIKEMDLLQDNNKLKLMQTTLKFKHDPKKFLEKIVKSVT